MGRPAVIVDVDGTLVDVSGIRHYVLDDPKRKKFEKFHAAASYARPMPMVPETVHALKDAGLAIVVLSSRRDRWRYRTRTWLRKWEIPCDLLLLRADDDARRDDDVKRGLHGEVLRAGFEPVLAIDDNPVVVRLWRSLGIPTVVVPGWVTEPRPSRTTSVEHQ